jgi:hypothetical protein
LAELAGDVKFTGIPCQPKEQVITGTIDVVADRTVVASKKVHILEMLLGAPPSGPVPLTSKILEIVSTVELSVTVVYTTTDGGGGAPSFDVKQIGAKLLII